MKIFDYKLDLKKPQGWLFLALVGITLYAIGFVLFKIMPLIIVILLIIAFVKYVKKDTKKGSHNVANTNQKEK